MQISKPIKKLKIKILNFKTHFSSNSNQNKNLHLQISSYAIIDGQISQHTIICTEFSKYLHVVCATSKCTKYRKGDM